MKLRTSITCKAYAPEFYPLPYASDDVDYTFPIRMQSELIVFIAV